MGCLLIRCRHVRVQGWACTQIFEGHSHYVMQCVFNPKDTNTFASASLDRTVKVRPWPSLTLTIALVPVPSSQLCPCRDLTCLRADCSVTRAVWRPHAALLPDSLPR